MDLIDRKALEEEVGSARRDGTESDPRKLLQWAHDLLGPRLMMSTAFGKTGMVILHMVKDIIPDLEIYFLDTGFHFQESLAFADRIRREWGLRITLHRPRLYGDAFRARHGERIYETDPDFCCHNNKVEPFAELIRRYQGWIAGIRRDQSSTRADAATLEVLETSKLKVQPLALWTRERVEEYLSEHRIPLHPLFSRGYTSIGCAPCTSPCAHPGADERAGRWAGKEKTECGLHLFLKKQAKSSPGPQGASPAASA